MVLRCRTILGSKRMEDSGNGKGSFFACYLLTSLNPRYKGCHYIGFTVNPRRRIRQHNGELTSGAWRTHRKRPWDMILCVYGFACQVEALQFEWAWQHPLKSLVVREAAGRIPSSVRGLKKQFYLLFTMLNCDKWSAMDLNVQFFSSKYIDYRKGCPGLPPHMGLSIAPVESLPVTAEEADSELDMEMEKETERGGSRETSNVEGSRDELFDVESRSFDFEEDDLNPPIVPQDCWSNGTGRVESLDRAKKQSKLPDASKFEGTSASLYTSSISQPLVISTKVSGTLEEVEAENLRDRRQTADTPIADNFSIRTVPMVNTDLLRTRHRHTRGPTLRTEAESSFSVCILETPPTIPCRAKTIAGQDAPAQSKMEMKPIRDIQECESRCSDDWCELPSPQALSPLPYARSALDSDTASPFSALLERYSLKQPSSIVKRCLQQKANECNTTRPESSASTQDLRKNSLPVNVACTPPCRPRVVVVIPDDTPIMSSREVIDLTDSPY